MFHCNVDFTLRRTRRNDRDEFQIFITPIEGRVHGAFRNVSGTTRTDGLFFGFDPLLRHSFDDVDDFFFVRMGVERMTTTRGNGRVNDEQIIGWSQTGSGMPDVMTTIDRFMRKGFWSDEHL